ncbi:twin-arginine translocation signal domain-containing protein [Deinococcota bacterium DY0809b]
MGSKHRKGMERRTFLKTVLGAGAAGLVAPALLGSRASA